VPKVTIGRFRRENVTSGTWLRWHLAGKVGARAIPMKTPMFITETPRIVLLAPAALLALGLACASGDPGLQSAAATPASPARDDATEPAIRAALAGNHRKDKERARDGARHPVETLAFFGLRSDATVVELWPGGGYYTAILAPVLAERGKLVVTHFDLQGDPANEDAQEAHAILDRLAGTPAVFGRVEARPISAKDFSFGPDASADFVLTFRNVHNWIEAGYADQVFAAAARVLKPGAVLGVEEHRGKPGMTTAQIKDTGYVPEDVVVQLAARAGLKPAGSSEINANPRDTKDYPHGVWSLPPTLAGKDVDRDKYVAIGESDRMTLRFVHP
jgi:predicted methyltransferase